jgi:hypothetical protein
LSVTFPVLPGYPPAIVEEPMADRTLDLHRDGFYAWTREQADALRRLAETRPNADVDWAHLIEEVEGLGKSDLRAVESQLRRVIEHCLKLAHSGADQPRRGWLNSVDDARAQISSYMTPSLRPDAEARLEQLYRQVLRRVRRDLEAYGEAEAAAALPAGCPFGFDQLVDEDWYPEPAAVSPSAGRGPSS